jgi:hypothetical protein
MALPEIRPIDFEYLLVKYDSICVNGEINDDLN